MPVIQELIRAEADGSISFGNYLLDKKARLDNFESGGDLYKVKTFAEMTKLERNGMFVYESVPGTAVEHFTETDDGVFFTAEGDRDVQITVQLEDGTAYEVLVDGAGTGTVRTNLSGKLSFSLELDGESAAGIRIEKR